MEWTIEQLVSFESECEFATNLILNFTAKIFGPVLCRHRNDQLSQRFILMFLTNDIKEFARLEFEKH